jgi:predicted phage terminase large subunit-like protein
MKSLLVSVLWPAWEWTRDPSLKYFAASYGQDLATRDTMKMRDIVSSDWYRQNFGVRFRADQEQKTWYINLAGGWRVASSVGGRGTGEHPDRRIIDDPHSAAQARSDVERQAALDWYDQTISTRGVTKNVREVVVMQRLHEQDLSGHLLEKGGWRHVMLPMRFEKDRACVGDPRTEDGQLLWPSLFPEAKVAGLELSLGEYGMAGQLQQRPAPIGGGLFKEEWFKVVDLDLPANDEFVRKLRTARKCRAWDVAGTEGGRGARTAGVRLADLGPDSRPRFVIESVVKGRWGAFEVDQAIHGIAASDGQRVRIREEQEGGSAGKAVIAARARALSGWDYRGVSASGDKETRANQFRTQAEAGEVALVKAAWNAEFIGEATVFPNGRTKDQIDAAAHAFNELMTGAASARVGKVKWG